MALYYFKKSPEEKKREYQRMNQEIRILDYASRLGYHVKKVGRYYTLEEHDSVRIDPDRNIFVRNSRFTGKYDGHSGGPIDFALEFSGKTKREILKEFSEMLDLQKLESINEMVDFQRPRVSHAEENAVLQLPERDDNIRNVFAYLVKSRWIDKDIVSEWIASRNLYQDRRKNCVFVSYDEKGVPIFACLRGTNTNVPFKGDLRGCDYERGFFLDNASTVGIIAESVIDAMSIMTILKIMGRNWKDYNYMILGSANKYKAVFYHMEKKPGITDWILALDNDAAGKLFRQKILDRGSDYKVHFLDFPSNKKDWNEELSFICENQIYPKYFIPDQDQMQKIVFYFDCIKRQFEYGDPDKPSQVIHTAFDMAIKSGVPNRFLRFLQTASGEVRQKAFLYEMAGSGTYLEYLLKEYNKVGQVEKGGLLEPFMKE